MHNQPWEWARWPTEDFACIRGSPPPILQGGETGVTAGVRMPRQQFTAAQQMGGPRRRLSMTEQANNDMERRSKRRSSSVAERRGRTRQSHWHHSCGATSGAQW